MPLSLSAPAFAPVSLWAVSAYELIDLVQHCSPRYADRAHIQLLRTHFRDALGLIREKLRSEPCDVVLTAGANADYLRSQLDIPVVAVRVGGYDVMAALGKACKLSKRIALVLYRKVPEEMREFVQCFGLSLELSAYDSETDARNTVAALHASGIQVVIGGGLVVHLAREHGMAGVFLYSRSSVESALDDAIRLAVAQQVEKARRITLSTVLEHLHEGVVAVDTRGRVLAANGAAQAFTGNGKRLTIGTPLAQCVPDLDPTPLLRDAAVTGSEVHIFQGRQVIVDRNVLRDGGIVTGALYTLQLSADVRQAFHKLRRHERQKGMTATHTLDRIVQASPEMKAVVRRCWTIAVRDTGTVLITGPSGVGKELLAQGIHNASSRKVHAFVAVNCGALAESLLESELFGYEEGAFTGARRSGKAGLIEAAHQGTLFLDEIAELPFALQSRLLRVLQEREITRVGGVSAIPVNIRVVAATHRDLLSMIKNGSFREDLYYRIAVLRIEVPALKSRPDDIQELARRFLREALREVDMSRFEESVLQVLLKGSIHHSWPGNGRELENVAQRIALACAEQDGPVSVQQIQSLIDWPGQAIPADSAGPTLSSVRKENEREHVLAVLASCQGNHEAAARRLGISRSTLWRKLQGHRGSS
jgi:propionate catabolism operon transcriptional regulator